MCSDWAVLLTFADERLQHTEVVLALTHVIKAAPLLATVGVLKIDAQDIFAHFARDMIARAKPRHESVPQARCQALSVE